MRIRSITYFLNPGWPVNSSLIDDAGKIVHSARSALVEAGFIVQSTRLATTPFSDLVSPGQAVEFSAKLEKIAVDAGFDYTALGPARTDHLDCYPAIPYILEATQSVFVSGEMTSAQGISLPSVRACASVIHAAAKVLPDGFANLRFAALANVQPGTPFFPAAYSAEGEPGFALAIESADMAVVALNQAGSIAEARQNLRGSIETATGALNPICERLAAEAGSHFFGFDFTLAPYPEKERSTGTAIEQVGVPALGLSGSLAASAILAEALDRAEFPRIGFNGLMLPVLEDYTIAQRVSQGLITVNDLLLYSTVCGTGLDCIPLPGDTSEERLTAILLDVAVLASRLNKPLTARLMPIPGKSSGDVTAFNFSYFANTRILPLPAAPLQGLLAGDETFEIKPRILHPAPGPAPKMGGEFAPFLA
jgi:uncharacterized protein (UPF0210 family)